MSGRHRLALLAACALFAVALAENATDVWKERAAVDDSRSRGDAFQDYRDTVHHPVRDLVAGHDPYAHEEFVARHPGSLEFDLYTPAWLAVVAPFAAFPYGAGAALWFAASALLAVGLSWLVLAAAGRWRGPPALVVALAGAVLLSGPGQLGLFSGQPHFLMAAAVTAALLGVAAVGHPTGRAAAVAAGTGVALLKPQWGVPLAILVAAVGYWRPVLVGVGAALAVSLVPLALAVGAAGGPSAFASDVADNARYSSSVYGDFADPELRRVDPINVPGQLADVRATTASQVAQALVVLAIAWVALRALPRRHPLVPVVMATAVLAAAPHFGYDAVVLVLPLVVLVAGSAARSLPVWRVACSSPCWPCHSCSRSEPRRCSTGWA